MCTNFDKQNQSHENRKKEKNKNKKNANKTKQETMPENVTWDSLEHP
jgi:hypothetical protein